MDRRDFLVRSGALATGSWVAAVAPAIGGCARTHTDHADDAAPEAGGAAPHSATGAAGSDDAAPAAGGAGAAAGAGSTAGSPARAGTGGGADAVALDAATPSDPSCADRGQRDLVVDVQLHAGFVKGNPLGIVLDKRVYRADPESFPWLDLSAPVFDQEMLAQLVLGDGDTSVAVFGTFPYPLPSEAGGRSIATNDDLLELLHAPQARFPRRVLAQLALMPNDRIELQLAMMDRLAADCAMWRVHTDWSPMGDAGFFLDEQVGAQVLGRGIELGAPIFAVHKGKPLPAANFAFTSPRDVGPAASMFPEARLVVCNAAFEHGLDWTQTSAPDPQDPDADLGWGPGVGEWPEGPYDETDSSVSDRYPLTRGVNSLIKSLRDAGIGPNGTRLDGAPGPVTHVYAACGAAWPCLIPRPVEAMHFWGKLLLHLGEDRVLWSTDSPWFGSPRVLIDAFRGFAISDELQRRHGYPALTPAIKAKILGQNAVKLFAARGLQLEGCHEDFAAGSMAPPDAGMIGGARIRSRRSLLGLPAARSA